MSPACVLQQVFSLPVHREGLSCHCDRATCFTQYIVRGYDGKRYFSFLHGHAWLLFIPNIYVWKRYFFFLYGHLCSPSSEMLTPMVGCTCLEL